MKIGNVTLQCKTVLAPMAGITDLPFRLLAKKMGAGLVYSEMISAKGLLYNNENTFKMLAADSFEHPSSVQLFGSDPEIIAEMAKKASTFGFDIIDINMGCPAPKIVKNGEGSALMKSPSLIGKIIKSASSAIKIPLTVKIRKGFDSENINAVEIAKIAEDNGAAAIAIHGRTREQYYSGTSDWEIIAKVKEAVTIPVIGNGDVTTPQLAKKMIDLTKCDAVMIGRAAQGNPWIFNQVNYFLETGQLLDEPSVEEKISTALLHTVSLIEQKGERTAILEMRKHLSCYIKGLPSAATIREKINKSNTYSQVVEILRF